jgi:hypothetical protein
MKNRFFMLAAAGTLALAMGAISCDNDDDNDNNNNEDLTGTYRMSSWNSPVAVDFDNNGTSSANLMTESSCFDNSTMTINDDGTYTMTYNDVGITGAVSSCRTETTTGTWARSGNSFTTTSGTGSSAIDTDYSFSSSGASPTMTRFMTGAQYPSINTTSGDPEYATGNVNMVFTRQ